MLYRDPERWLDPRDWLRQHRAAMLHPTPLAGHDAAVRLLVHFGELEVALSDRLLPDADALSPPIRALRRLALRTGHLLRCSWRGIAPPDEDLSAEWNLLEQLIAPVNGPLRIRVPEGFALYGLYPETYLEAAERFARTTPPGHALCIGLRTIGAPLSAVVAAALEAAGWQVTTFTLRPRGEPFDRRPVPGPELSKLLRAHAGEHALVVDEGPGLSGSSLAGTVEVLRAHGLREPRIAVFPSWDPEAARLRSPAARAQWPQLAKWIGDFQESWIDSGRLSSLPLTAQDGGRWRAHFFAPEEYPAIQPHHERRKYLSVEPAPRLFKFAGLGAYGEAAFERAAILAEAGFAPPVHALRHGFLIHRFVTGRPLRAGECTPSLIEHVARYLAFLQRTFPAAHRTAGVELQRMTAWHLRETFGIDWKPPQAAQLFESGPAVQLDGRMQPWEWLATRDGILKTDAVDHHADHFFPGCTDIAWDLAGFAAEFALDESATAHLVRRFQRHSGDTTLHARLPFFRIAYCAFAAGYARLAMETTAGTPEADRFRRREQQFRNELRRALHAHPA